MLLNPCLLTPACPPARLPRPPARLQVNYWLGGLMEVKSNDLYRMKGVLAIKDFDRRFVFQVGGWRVGGGWRGGSLGGQVWGGTAALGLVPGRAAMTACTPMLSPLPPCTLPAWLQGVHMLFEGMPDRLWKEGEKRVSKMVFIGRDLDRDLIREGFEECVVARPAQLQEQQ